MIWPALLLATLLIAGYFTHAQAKRATKAEARATRRTTERDKARANLVRERDANKALVRLVGRAVRGQAEVALDAEWLAICLATTEAERDMYRTAFTSLLANQARSELIAPEEPCGRSNVIEVPAGRWAK